MPEFFNDSIPSQMAVAVHLFRVSAIKACCIAPAATLALGAERNGHIGPQRTRPKCRRSATGLRDNTAGFMAG